MFTLNSEPRSAARPESWLSSWMLASLMTGVTVISARFSEYIPPTPVPLTLQVFAVMLTGLLLGRKWGAVAQFQYLALGAAGLPVFAKGGLGFASLFGVTGGYLLSYPIAAYVVGSIAGRPGTERATLRRQLLACAAGLAIIYGIGCAWYLAFAHASLADVLLRGALVFLAWDCVKTAVAIMIARGIGARGSRTQP